MGMVVTPSSSYCITPFIFWGFKSIDLESVSLRINSVSHLLPCVKSSHATGGEEGMANESFFSESRELGGGSFSIDDLLGCENVGSEQAEESVFNIDRVGDIDSDDSEPILRFKRTKLTLKPAKTPYPRHFKTTTSPSIPLNVPLPRSKMRSLGPPIILPLLDDTIEIQGKRKQSSSTSVKTAPPQTSQKPTSKSVRE